MKKNVYSLIIVFSIIFVLAVGTFGCVRDDQNVYTVTFDYNYSGALNNTSKTDKNGMVSKPEDPTRLGFTFSGWFVDSICTIQFNFESEIKQDTVLYAKWLDNSITYRKVTFDYNYPDSTPIVLDVVDGESVTAPGINTRTQSISSDDGKYSYEFFNARISGWYTDSGLSSKYNMDSPVTSDMTLYAKWYYRYNFEAELTNLEDKQGTGYSLGVFDEQLIRTDTKGDGNRNQNASNGYSVGFLYYYGLSVDYKIYSERAISGVKFEARLSAEYRDIFIAPEHTVKEGQEYQAFKFKVNGVSISYNPIALTGAKAQLAPNQRPFDDWTISTEISLNEGWNDIVLLVDNAYQFETTISAMAPMIDCIYLSTDQNLSWSPKWSNMNKIEIVE